MILTPEELKLIKDQEFLLTKIKVTAKIRSILLDTKTSLTEEFERGEILLPDEHTFTPGKISKGENYLGLPYQVLDFPASFHKKQVFAFRTMFWWGNFFSVTLHIQGTSLDMYRKKIIENINLLENQHVFIGIGETPWQYHYEQHNFDLLRKSHIGFIEHCDFLKLSKKIDLEKWHELPSFSSEFFRQVLLILS